MAPLEGVPALGSAGGAVSWNPGLRQVPACGQSGTPTQRGQGRGLGTEAGTRRAGLQPWLQVQAIPLPHPTPRSPRKGGGALNTPSGLWPVKEEGCPRGERWGACQAGLHARHHQLEGRRREGRSLRLPGSFPPPCPASSHSASSMGRGWGYLQGQGGIGCAVGGSWKASPRRCRLSR